MKTDKPRANRRVAKDLYDLHQFEDMAHANVFFLLNMAYLEGTIEGLKMGRRNGRNKLTSKTKDLIKGNRALHLSMLTEYIKLDVEDRERRLNTSVGEGDTGESDEPTSDES